MLNSTLKLCSFSLSERLMRASIKQKENKLWIIYMKDLNQSCEHMVLWDTKCMKCYGENKGLNTTYSNNCTDTTHILCQCLLTVILSREKYFIANSLIINAKT